MEIEGKPDKTGPSGAGGPKPRGRRGADKAAAVKRPGASSKNRIENSAGSAISADTEPVAAGGSLVDRLEAHSAAPNRLPETARPSDQESGQESAALPTLYNKVYPEGEFGDESARDLDDSTPVIGTSNDVIHIEVCSEVCSAEFTESEPPPIAAALAVRQTPRPLQENPAAVYLSGLAPGSRRTMRGSLNQVAGLLTSGRCTNCLELDWANLRFQHTSALRALLAEKYAAATVNKILCALRGTLKAAWRLGQLSAEEYARARDVSSVSGEVIPAGRSLAGGEIAALMAACQSDRERSLGTRDAAILALLYGCGLRRAEVVALQLADYREEATGVSLRVRGKRNKQRLVPLTGGVADAVGDWLGIRGRNAAVDSTIEDKREPSPHLFNPFRKGGRRQDDRAMTTQAVYVMLEKRAREAGVGTFSPHDCRRTFVGDLLDRGADIVTVQKLAGHASVATTARYDRRGEGVKRKAAELLHVPYRRAG